MSQSRPQLQYDSPSSQDGDSRRSGIPSINPSETNDSVTSLGSFSVELAVDHDDSDVDSAMFETSREPSSASLSSSIFHFVEEHGRTYHRYKEGKYWMPNDARERERLDLQHIICLKVFRGQLALAPIQSPHRVLDFGTGTGAWAIDFAREHSESDVLGTDLSPIQPEFVPPNCRFEIDDIEDEWVFSHKFDYIHSRHMVGSLTNFPKLFRSIYENLNPGGWVEMQDYHVKLRSIDGTLEGTALQRWNLLLNHALSFTKRSGLQAVRYKHWMKEVGFLDIREELFAVPGNPWAKGREQKELGALQLENILEGLHGMSMSLFTKFLGMRSEEVEAMLIDVRKDLQNRDIHFYYPIMSVYGRKPT